MKFMREIGLEKMGISKLIKEGYDLLNLETFFTSGKEESRAWTIKKKYFLHQKLLVLFIPILKKIS